MAATSAVKPAIKAIVYRNTGTYGSPTWTSMTLVKDVTPNTQWVFGDASVRATRVELSHPTQMQYEISMTMRDDDADAGVQAIKTIAMTGDNLDLLIMDAPISIEGARGVRAHFHAAQTQDQSIGAIIYNTFTLKPGFHTDGYPKYAVAGSGSALTYTAPGA